MDSALFLESLLSDAALNHFSLTDWKVGHSLKKRGQYKCLLPISTVSIFSRDICKGQEPAKRMRTFGGEHLFCTKGDLTYLAALNSFSMADFLDS